MSGAAESILADLPLALRNDLCAIRPRLELAGYVQRRDESDRGPSWRLRYRDEDRSQRSLRLPDEASAEAARALIGLWREERQQREEESAEAAKLAAMSPNEQWAYGRRDELSALRDLAAAMAGGGRRRRRKAAERFDKAREGGPVQLFYYAMLKGWAEPNPAGGRPRKRGLW